MFSTATSTARTDQPDPNTNPVIAPPHVLALLDRLHELSIVQEEAATTEAVDAEDFDNFMSEGQIYRFGSRQVLVHVSALPGIWSKKRY